MRADANEARSMVVVVMMMMWIGRCTFFSFVRH